jgi:HSP20 family protein
MAKKNFVFTQNEAGGNFSSGISTYVDWEPRSNIIEVGEGEMLIIEVELPGVNKEDVNILLEEANYLIIRGLKRQPRLNDSDVKRATYYLFEREFGSFYKRIFIDFPLDASRIKSTMENGVLTVRIPRKKSEKIAVEVK